MLRGGTIVTKAAWSRDDYASKLKQCIEWIESEGIQVSKASRYGQYLALIENMQRLNSTKKMNLHGGVSTAHDVVNVYREVREIDRVRRYFQAIDGTDYRIKLSKIVNGPTHFVSEKSDGGAASRARNIFLELRIGAEFLKQGFAVRYGDDSYPEPLVILGKRECPCECKRLQVGKTSAVRRNILKAVRQLKSNMGDYNKESHGLVVLDISKIMNPQGAVLFDHDTSGGRLKSIADIQIDQFRDDHIYAIDWSEYIHVGGVILFASYMTTSNPKATCWTYMSRTRIVGLQENVWVIPELVNRQKIVPSRGVSTDLYDEEYS